jgi:uncharacterized protein (DUF433 family)
MNALDIVSALPIVLVPHPHVRVDKKVLGGSPHVSGSRVPVRRLFAFYRSGTPIEKILKRYPQLSPAKVFDALAFALDNPEVLEADMEREAELLDDRNSRRAKRLPGLRQVELPFAGLTANDGPTGPTRN